MKLRATTDTTNSLKHNDYQDREHINSDVAEPRDMQAEPIRVQQQLLDDETRALQVELSGLLDAAQQTETKMVEMSALNHLMSIHVLQQAQQIELLYDQLKQHKMYSLVTKNSLKPSNGIRVAGRFFFFSYSSGLLTTD